MEFPFFFSYRTPSATLPTLHPFYSNKIAKNTHTFLMSSSLFVHLCLPSVDPFFFRHTVANARDSQNEFRPQPNTFSLPLLALSLCAFILSALLYLHIKSWYIPAELLPAIRSKQCFCSAPFYTPSLTEYHLFCNWHFLFCFFGAWVSKEWGGEIQIYGCAYRNL